MPSEKKIMQYGRHGLIKICNITPDTKAQIPNMVKDDLDDLCPVCDENLFYNDDVTKRIAILNNEQDVTGWVCPECFTEFDMEAHVVTLMSKQPVQGET
jgi:hypothetical protein